MAGVEHAYQYTVEVKSRFSLFLDDTLNNEDPDLLISKLQQGKNKKEKSSLKSETKGELPVDVKPKQDISDDNVVKSPPSASQAEVQPHEVEAVKPQTDVRGRGDGRGFRARGRAITYNQNKTIDMNGEVSDHPGEGSRMRGRGRGRFFRGRGYAYTDYRELHSQDRGNLKSGLQNEAIPEQSGGKEEQEIEVINNTEPVSELGSDFPAKDSEPEEERKTYTLEEYKAMRSSSRPVITLANKNTRKANDGKDVFKNMVVHRKITEVADDKENSNDHPDKESTTVEKYEINVTFTDRIPERERSTRGYGGRGFGRGRGSSGLRGRGRGVSGPRGSYRGDRGRGSSRGAFSDHPAAPVINSDQDFPTLK